MGVYLSAKFEVSSIILTGFRDGEGDFTSPPKKKPDPPKKSPPRLGLRIRVYLIRFMYPVLTFSDFVSSVYFRFLSLPFCLTSFS